MVTLINPHSKVDTPRTLRAPSLSHECNIVMSGSGESVDEADNREMGGLTNRSIMVVITSFFPLPSLKPPLKNKLDIVKAMMDCLLAKAIPCVTDCVVAELEKLGPKYRVALRLSKDPRFRRLPCSHAGTYADDCLVQVLKPNSLII